ncbi:MAG: class I SAM-dependent methyltransferase [Candidatus Omnitrophica bacterium]|nr:class I SAM-dependent methyltransferase [Candidatus Omnitrophota bacterium]
MFNKKTRLTATADTAEAYDQYFEQVKAVGIPRARYRTKKALTLIKSKKGKVLSVGIGGLGEANELKAANFDVVLCDISQAAVDHAEDSGFEAVVCDITKENLTSQFDYIFALEVLEHLINPLQALGNLKSALKPDGKIIISLPNEFNLRARLSILFGRPPFGGHDCHHLRFFNEKFAEKMFTENDLKILKKAYCPSIPLWNKLSICVGEFLMKALPNLFSTSIIWVLENETKENTLE